MIIVPVTCKECGGSGRNGTLGGYALICIPCAGRGFTFREYAGG